ncbi:MAG: isoprenylcysteine carboxylmethyltransferase family protein [Isosphaeraceae bacterium]
MAIFVRIVMIEVFLGVILFGSAGRLDLPWFWALLGVHTTLFLGGAAAMSPELREERMRPGSGGEGRRFRWLMIPLILTHLAIAGLDVGRYGWTGPLPWGVQAAGLVVYVLAMGLSLGSMLTNPFFSPVIRIQAERGHQVVSAGPYRVIRHPGYLGLVTGAICGGIALGSLWSLLPVVPMLVSTVIRTAREDQFLRAHLEGYAAYALRVRSRLIPGVW